MAEFIEILSPSALKDLQTANVEVLTLIKNIDNAGKSMQNIKTPSGSDSAVKNLNAQLVKQESIIVSLQDKLQKATEKQQIALEKTRLQEIKLQQQREKAFDSYEKQLQKEEQLLQKAEGAYQRIQNSVNVLTQTYKNLAIRKELGGNLTIKEEAQLVSLTNRLNMYQNALKKVDATIGNHQREVGNYAKANSNLSNSIGQISRELPNFGQSFSVGVLSLTNNIGALIDGIKQVKAQNAELQNQGKQTKSVFSQILGSFLSWQTALFIGIGIFSAYSKEIGQFVSDLFSASDAIKASERAMIDAYEAKERYNSASGEALKQTRKEIDDYLILTSIMKDNTKTQEERLNAAKRIKEQYPGYLKNYTEEQILAYQSGKANKELSKTINQLASDIKKRNLAQAQSTESTKTFSLIADLREEFRYREAINKQINNRDFSTRELYKKRAKERTELVNDSEEFVAKFGKATINELGAFDLTEINNLKIRYNALLTEFTAERDAVNKKLVETSLLDFKPDRDKKDKKAKREKIKLNFEEVESEYNLKLAILERQKAEMNDRASNDESLFEDRIKAIKEYSEKSIEILELEVKKEKALIQERFLDDLEKNNLAYRNKDINSQQWSKNIEDITKRTNNQLNLIDMNYSLQWNNLLNENAKFYKDIQDKNREYAEQTNKIILDGEKTKYEKISNDSKKTLTLRQKAFEQYIELSKKELEIQKIKDLANAKSNEEIILISQKYADAIAKLGDLSSPIKKAREETEAFIQKIASGQLEKSLNEIGVSSAKMFLDFDANGQTTFDKLLEGADTFKEKFAVVFQAVGDVAQDIFSKIFEMQNQRFTNELTNLEREKDIAILFAGESASAREEINKQYDIKQRDIKNREARAKKGQAIFNILVDTAQGVVSALASTPPNVPLSIAIGAIGAIQAGIVASQQIPQFAVGVENSQYQGLAIKDEQGAELHFDKRGNIKDFGQNKGAKYTYVEKGDTILTAPKTERLIHNQALNSILTSSGIMPTQIVNNSTNVDMSGVIKAIENKPSVINQVDKGGFRQLMTNGHTTKEITNRRINGASYDV